MLNNSFKKQLSALSSRVDKLELTLVQLESMVLNIQQELSNLDAELYLLINERVNGENNE